MILCSCACIFAISAESDVRGITKMFGSDRGDGKYVSAVCDILCILGKLLEHSGKIVGEG